MQFGKLLSRFFFVCFFKKNILSDFRKTSFRLIENHRHLVLEKRCLDMLEAIALDFQNHRIEFSKIIVLHVWKSASPKHCKTLSSISKTTLLLLLFS